MGQLIAIGGVLLALLGLASFWVLKLMKGSKLEITTKIQDKTAAVQREQLEVGNDQPTDIDDWKKRIDKGEPI
jgi:cytoskeletal protein RodZ